MAGARISGFRLSPRRPAGNPPSRDLARARAADQCRVRVGNSILRAAAQATIPMNANHRRDLDRLQRLAAAIEMLVTGKPITGARQATPAILL